jgi:hypothetical protein
MRKFIRTLAVCCFSAGAASAQQYQAPQPSPYADPQASTNNIFSQSLGSIDERYRGSHPYFNDDVIGRALSWAQPRTVAEVCTLWRTMPPNFPVTGNVSVFGVEFSLDRICGVSQGSQASPGQSPWRFCERWRNGPADLPVTGNFSVLGFELSIDKACGIRREVQTR